MKFIRFSCKWKKVSKFRFEIFKKFLKPIRYFSKCFFQKTNSFFSNFVFFISNKNIQSSCFFHIQKQISTYSAQDQISRLIKKSFSVFNFAQRFIISIWSYSIIKKFIYVNLINFKIYYERTSLSNFSTFYDLLFVHQYPWILSSRRVR